MSIVSVFGKFAVELEDGPELFNTEAEAATALSSFANGAEHRQLAADYCAYKVLDGKNAVGKTNVIVSYLAWVDSGAPVSGSDSDDTAGTPEATPEVEF